MMCLAVDRVLILFDAPYLLLRLLQEDYRRRVTSHRVVCFEQDRGLNFFLCWTERLLARSWSSGLPLPLHELPNHFEPDLTRNTAFAAGTVSSKTCVALDALGG